MGFNTVAFLLNDFMHLLKDSPMSVLWTLGHPPMSDRREELHSIRSQVLSVAKAYDEPVPHPQMLEVLPSFHADLRRYYMAGQNSLINLEAVKYTKVDGKRCVVLELPEYLQK